MSNRRILVLLSGALCAAAFAVSPVKATPPHPEKPVDGVAKNAAPGRDDAPETSINAPAADKADASPADDAPARPATPAEPAAETANGRQYDAPPLQQTPPQSDRDDPTPRAPILDAASTRVSFQAVLTDNLGNALVGPVNLRFQVYTSPGGAPVGAAINVLAVSVTNGVVDTQVPIPTSSFDGTGRELGVTVNAPAAELTPRMPITAVPYAYRVDRVASAELDDNIDLGTSAASGTLNVYRTAANTPGVTLDGSGSQISTFGSDGLEQIRLWGPTWGELWLNDDVGNNTTVFLSANGNAGGLLQLREPAGANRALLSAPATGGVLTLNNASSASTINLNGSNGHAESQNGFYALASIGGNVWAKLTSGGGGNLRTYASNGTTETVVMGTAGSGTTGGFLQIKQADGGLGMNVDGDAGTNAGGQLTVYQADGSSGVVVDGDATNADGGGLITVNDPAGTTGVSIDGYALGNGGSVNLYDADGTNTVQIDAADSTTSGGQIILRKADGTYSIEIDAEFGAAGSDGRIITPVLQISGGSDLSENFDVQTPDGADPLPGSVVCISANKPGELVISSRAYDHTVAGIVSGAGGVKTGMLMAQRGTAAYGKHPIALSGRVYCLADASHGAITPGDLLTTSATPGHAMKVSDHAAAQGAVIGKAMSSLENGRGLVLVLVNLQ